MLVEAAVEAPVAEAVAIAVIVAADSAPGEPARVVADDEGAAAYDTTLPPGRLAARPVSDTAATTATLPQAAEPLVRSLYTFDSIESETATEAAPTSSVEVDESTYVFVESEVLIQHVAVQHVAVADAPTLLEPQFDPALTVFSEPVPLPEHILDQYYINNQLHDFGPFLRRFYRDADNPEHELAQMIKDYAAARLDVQVTLDYFKELRGTAEATAANAWLVRTEEAKAAGKCRDGMPVSMQQPYEVAEYAHSVCSDGSSACSTQSCNQAHMTLDHTLQQIRSTFSEATVRNSCGRHTCLSILHVRAGSSRSSDEA